MESKRRLGDRKDGRLIHSLAPFYKFMPYIMPTKNDACNQFEDCIEITDTDRWLRQKRLEGYKGLGYLHLFIAAYVRMVSMRPGFNRFVAGRRIYARNNIEVVLTVRRTMSTTSNETTIKAVFAPTDTIFDVYRKMNEKIDEIKYGGEDNNTEQVAGALLKLPRPEYIDLLASLAAENGQGGEALVFSAADRDTVGQAVVDAANGKKPGAGFTLAADTRETGGGVVLQRGRMEINCGFAELLRRARQEDSSAVAAVLCSVGLTLSGLFLAALALHLVAPGSEDAAQWALFIHLLCAGVMAVVLPIHIYMAAFAPGEGPALRSMFSGFIPVTFIRHHNPLWYEQLVRKGVIRPETTNPLS